MPKPDAYAWQARVYPLLLVVSPAIVFLATSALLQVTVAFGGAVLLAVATAVAAEVGRHRGKMLEPGLWASWGGAPSVQRLRYAGAPDASIIDDRHKAVTAATVRALPTAADEERDATKADGRYADVLRTLRDKTREDVDLLRENTNYGFRRNTLGLRGWGIAASLLVLVAAIVFFAASPEALGARVAGSLPAAVCSLVLLGFFWRIVSPDWVRTAAETYADRLIGAAEKLAGQAVPR
jgi:hypothetical protein